MSRSNQKTQRSETEPLRILQVTDSHLYADPEGRLLGQSTRLTLEMVLEAAGREPKPADIILLTGDLSHDQSSKAYSYLQRRMEVLGTPCYCLPGNHDDPLVMRRVFESGGVTMAPTVRVGPWHLVLLDSTIRGTDGGHLDSRQLALLRDSLAARPADPTLVCLHHQPVLVGSAWMDTMALDNPEAFFQIIDGHSQVRGILWGHIHQHFSCVRNGVRLLGSPSTCIQFLPKSADFALDILTPGYRWLELYSDGRIETGVERITAYPDPLVMSNQGY